MLMHILNVGVGMTFSGGIIDLTLFGILQGNRKTNWVMILLVGIAYFIIYFFLFRFLILKKNYATPGREDDSEETKLYTRADYNAKKNSDNVSTNDQKADEHRVSRLILDGLGGKDNIVSIDCCATRLRVSVKNGDTVSDTLLKQSGAAGVIKKGTGIQVVYGPQVAVIKSEGFFIPPYGNKSELEDYIKTL